MDQELVALLKQFGGAVVERSLTHELETALTPDRWDAIIQGLNTLAVAAEGRNAGDFSKALVTLAIKFV